MTEALKRCTHRWVTLVETWNGYDWQPMSQLVLAVDNIVIMTKDVFCADCGVQAESPAMIIEEGEEQYPWTWAGPDQQYGEFEQLELYGGEPPPPKKVVFIGVGDYGPLLWKLQYFREKGENPSQ